MGSEGAAGEPSVLRASARDVVPWRNGAGTTTVVAEGPPAEGGPATEPAWRISIATIDRSAPFSEFAGVDRLLMPLSPAGLDLVIDGRRVRGEAFDVLPFAGESAVEAVDVRGTGLDLNLMTGRGSAAGTLVARHLDGELTLRSPGSPGSPASPSSWTVAVVVEGDVSSPAHGALALHDAVVIPSGGAVQLTGRAAVIALAVIEPTRAS
ncbi:HutD family protein [Frigoribacterium sp. CFBP 13712]|uniref:HutD/Ves family protein n=1 Tax=Frigoribacterium sp. CFBP 13712 TaxID=2775309 RepID=UPI001785579F|nr:HutD family protein [Frigoribacterium sp. CFBP 13712]MBD8704635.1 HutD family protein [Frigoribacterium sp. CFBP 13712]